MKRIGFVSTLVLGALGAAVLPAAVLLLGGFLGARTAGALFAASAALAYAVLLPRQRGTRVATAVGGLVALAGVALVARGPGDLVLCGLLTLSAARLASERGCLRHWIVEGGLLAAALLALAVLLPGGLLDWSLAFWSCALIQSVWFLVGGMATGDADEESGDAFARARDRLSSLLDEEGVH